MSDYVGKHEAKLHYIPSPPLASYIPESAELFGTYIDMGALTEESIVEHMAYAAKQLLKQMHDIVNPYGPIEIIFKMTPSIAADYYNTTAGWKCFGKAKGAKDG